MTHRIARRRTILIFVTLAAAMAGMSVLAAADMPSATARKIATAIQVDGLLADAPWREQPSIAGFIQAEPRSGEAPTEKTSVWLAYTKDTLFVAVKCADSRPRDIVATEMRRDSGLENNDNIEFILDTYNDHRNAYYFATNPAGALTDGRVTENGEPSMEWDGIWNVRTHIAEDGWTAEFEIPFKTLGFNPNLDNWGFNVSRHLARIRETSRWASPSFDVRLSQPIRAGDIMGIEGISQGIGIDIKPYGLVGASRDINRADPVSAVRDVGMDIFYRITSNLVSATTFNTDFAETEVDQRQVNLTRFQLFFPEKRAFFLEDAGVFDFAKGGEGGGAPGGGGGDLMPFFSRRIGLLYGDEVPIRAGEKVTGKVGRFDIGVMDVQTGALNEPDGQRRAAGRNLAVGRVKANFLSQSYIGALFTNGDPAGETSNQVGGLDMKLATSNFMKRGKNLSLSLFGTKSYTTGVVGKDTSFGGEIAYPNDMISLGYKWLKIGENYNPALGFVPRRGVRISSTSAEFRPRPRFWGIRQMSFEFGYTDYYNMANHASETQELELTPFQWFFHSGEMMGIEVGYNRERLFEPWEIADGIVLPVDRYSFDTKRFQFRSSESRPLAFEVEASTGGFFSGTRRQLVSGFTWRKNEHLTTSFQMERNWIKLDQGSFNATIVEYRLDYSFTPRLTLSNFVQYDTESQNIGLQSRFRWTLRPGNDLFVVLNHAWQENAFDRFESAQTRFRAKLNYTFRF
jgi:hypothetical protein